MDELLDWFFASLGWILKHASAGVQYVAKQSSDNCLLIFYDKTLSGKSKWQFYFDKKIIDWEDSEQLIDKA